MALNWFAELGLVIAEGLSRRFEGDYEVRCLIDEFESLEDAGEAEFDSAAESFQEWLERRNQ